MLSPIPLSTDTDADTMRTLNKPKSQPQKNASTGVPVVDFAPFYYGTETERAAVCLEVFNAFKDIGFVTLVNHGVDVDLIDNTFKQSQQFFDLPQQEKMKSAYTTAEANRGYLNLGREVHSKVDFKETFEIGNENEKKFANRWPSQQKMPQCKFKPCFS